MASMDLSVPDSMRDWVQTRIESGHYASVTEYVRDLIRRDQAQTEVYQALVAALLEGEAKRCRHAPCPGDHRGAEGGNFAARRMNLHVLSEVADADIDGIARYSITQRGFALAERYMVEHHKTFQTYAELYIVGGNSKNGGFLGKLHHKHTTAD